MGSFDYNMIEFLLQQDADALDCDRSELLMSLASDVNSIIVSDLVRYRSGRAALLEFLKISGNVSGSQINKIEFSKILRLLIQHCGVDVYSVVQYESPNHETVDGVDGPLNYAFANLGAQPAVLFETVQMLLQHGCDLEDRNVEGSTPLLSALCRVPDPQLVSLANLLLSAGADPLAVDFENDGCLHLLLRRLSACNNFCMSSIKAKGYTDLLVTLLRKGCSTFLRNDIGYTPIDLALSPTAWVLWCDALREAGLEVERVLKEDDIVHGVSHSESDIVDKGYSTGLVKNLAIFEKNYCVTYSHRACYLCSQGTITAWARRPPFDYLESPQSKPENLAIAGHILREPTYFGPENDRNGELERFWAALSWRKHLAYRLWHDGTLDSPYNAQMWATGSEVYSNETHEPSLEVQDTHVQREKNTRAAWRDQTCQK